MSIPLTKDQQQEVRLQRRTSTWFDYRGVRVEICHPIGDTHYGWTYYLYLHLDRFADEKLRRSLWLKAKPSPIGGRKFHRYTHNQLLVNLDFHGGITYYQKCLGTSDERLIKIGCDYDHLWDQGKFYGIDSLIRDAKRTVDDLHERAVYLLFCQGDGRLVPESEMQPGTAYSKGYILEEQAKGRMTNFVVKASEAQL